MIPIPTTFVVGAGGSKPYGLPLGAELLDRLRGLDPTNDLYRTLVGGNDPKSVIAQLNPLIEAAKEHPGPSIDALLEDQPHHRDIGHAIIAGLMGTSIALRKQQPVRDKMKDWLKYLIGEMRIGCSGDGNKFANENKITFITFNFDTVIEDALERASVTLYGKGTKSPLDTIRVIHLHGVLPAIVNRPDRWWIDQASETVKVIYDELDSKTIEEARAALKNSHVIAFLGFHYHPENLRTLGIPGSLSGDVYGTALELGGGERARIERRFGGNRNIQLGGREMDSLQFLREFDVIRS